MRGLSFFVVFSDIFQKTTGIYCIFKKYVLK